MLLGSAVLVAGNILVFDVFDVFSSKVAVRDCDSEKLLILLVPDLASVFGSPCWSRIWFPVLRPPISSGSALLVSIPASDPSAAHLVLYISVHGYLCIRPGSGLDSELLIKK